MFNSSKVILLEAVPPANCEIFVNYFAINLNKLCEKLLMTR